MKVKQMLYPKTQRMTSKDMVWQVTEKLDGSNLTLFKLNGQLYFGTRNWVFNFDEDVKDSKDVDYKGLYDWLVDNKEELLAYLNDGEALFGEWLGMGNLKYEIPERFNLFAVGYIGFDQETGMYDVKTIKRKVDDIRVFMEGKEALYKFIAKVPFVAYLESLDKNKIDRVYDMYSNDVGRNVEGFVLVNLSTEDVVKYVRMKRGKLESFWKPEDIEWELV